MNRIFEIISEQIVPDVVAAFHNVQAYMSRPIRVTYFVLITITYI